MTEALRWFDCHLRSPGCDTVPAVYIAPEGWTGDGTLPLRRGMPATKTTTLALPGVSTIAKSGKVVRTTPRLGSAIEIFGSPTVEVSVAPSGRWSRLVAVLTAKTPKGGEILVSAGGVPTKAGARKVTIQLIDQATYIPQGSRLQLTLASSSTAQSSGNLLYLDLPMPSTARVRVGTAVLKLPGLRTPVTK
jgi:predicted acyl esterase